YTIETMRSFGQEPTLTELNQAIMNEAKYKGNWSAATTLFQDFDKLVWKRLARLDNMTKNLENVEMRNETNKLTFTQLWLQTPVALRPLSKTEIRYIRQAYQIMSNDIDIMEKGLELVQIALNRNLQNKQLEVLADVSKEIFAHYGLRLNKIHGSLEKNVSSNQKSVYDVNSLIGCKKGKKSGKHGNRSLRIPEPMSADLME
ncbi:16569_t:CDS:2, partial [Racocetra fulgida]